MQFCCLTFILLLYVYICDDYDGGGDHITIKYKIAF